MKKNILPFAAGAYGAAMITPHDIEGWYGLESKIQFGIPCHEVVDVECACAGREKNLILIFLPGEADFLLKKTGVRFTLTDHDFQGRRYQTAKLPKGCGSCLFGPKCSIYEWRPLECRFFPVAPPFLGIGNYFDHCPYQHLVSNDFLALGKRVWGEVFKKAEKEWVDFYRSFVRLTPHKQVDKIVK